MPDKFPHLSKSPIQAAILEIRFASKNSVLKAEYEKEFLKNISNEYPASNRSIERNINIQTSEKGKDLVEMSETGIVGFRFFSKDKNKTITILPDRFSITTNNTYTTWEDFSAEFLKLWDIFFNQVYKSDLNILGLSTRFINRFEVRGLKTPTDFFKTTIYADEGIIEGNVDSYLMRYVTKVSGQKIQIHVIQGFDSPIGDVSPFNFDIDVIYNSPFELKDIGGILNNLRKYKNSTFFNNLTDKTLNSII